MMMMLLLSKGVSRGPKKAAKTLHQLETLRSMFDLRSSSTYQPFSPSLTHQEKSQTNPNLSPMPNRLTYHKLAAETGLTARFQTFLKNFFRQLEICSGRSRYGSRTRETERNGLRIISTIAARPKHQQLLIIPTSSAKRQ